MPNWPIDRLEVLDPEYSDVDPEVSNFPDHVDSSEVADLLGVSRHRIHEWRRGGQFPLPMAELATGPVWSRPAIVAFAEQRDREPGQSGGTTWTSDMVDEYRSLGDRMRGEPQNRPTLGEQQDGVVRPLVNRHRSTVAATVLGIPINEVKSALARLRPDHR
jgi:hypothetical protein